MTPGQIVNLAMDVLIAIAVIALWVFIYRSGENADIKADLQAMQKQLTQNAQLQGKWESERITAEAQRYADMQTVTRAIESQRTPVRLCDSPSSGGVPPPATTPIGNPPSPGGVAGGSGADLRQSLNAFELKYEAYLGSCRSVLNQWPKEK